MAANKSTIVGDINLQGFLTVGASFDGKYTGYTSTHVIDATDYVVDCTTGTFTVTLPTAASIAGRIYHIKNSGTGIIVVACNGGETIDGLATRTLAIQYESIMVQSNGTNWIIL